MKLPVRRPYSPLLGRGRPSLTRQHLIGIVSIGAVAILLQLVPGSADAAPAEGTAGQSVTHRAISRADTVSRPPERRQQLAPSQATPSKPSWKELTPAQQTALQPLAPHWDRLTEKRKQKWLLISKSYPKLHPTEQAKLHTRMSEWASFSQRQRSQARQVYKETKGLTAEQKAEQWRAYQALSAEEKKKLAISAGAVPSGVTAIKPTPSPKLATVPFSRKHSPAHNAKVETAGHPLSPQSLLPRQGGLPRDAVPTNPYEDDDADQP